MYSIVAGRRVRLLGDGARRPCCIAGVLALLVLASWAPATARAENLTAPGAKSELAAELGRQQLRHILAERLPDLTPDQIERVAQNFEKHLRLGSRLIADNYAEGRLEESELVSRLSVYLRDNPQQVLGKTEAVDTVRTRVQAAIASHDTGSRTKPETVALTNRFMLQLAERNRIALQSLNDGRMGDDELASRVSIFLEDLRNEAAAASGGNPVEAAAAELVAEQFVKKNFGDAHERATALAYDCTISDAESGRQQKLRILRRSPNKVRFVLLNDEIATLVMAYDGAHAWAQQQSAPPRPLDPERAATLGESAPFDHPLVSYKERGAQLSLRGGNAQPFELTLLERDGSSTVSTIDPVTYHETRQVVCNTQGRISELRLSDFQTVGTTTIACRQELWRGGSLRITTTIANPSTSVVLLDGLFQPPAASLVDYMDYMGGLALLQRHATTGTPALPSAAP